MGLDLGAHNQRVASAVFRAGLVDEPTLRALLAERPPVDLAQRLVQLGRVRADVVARLLGASGSVGPPSGRFGAVADATLPMPHRPQPVATTPVDRAAAPHVGSSGAPHVGSPAPHVGGDDRTVLAPPRLLVGVDDPTVVAPPNRQGPATGPGGVGTDSRTGSGVGSSPGSGGSRSGPSSFGVGGVGGGDAGPLHRALLQPPGTALNGLAFGPYRLERLLAKGGMGAVFVAQHASLGRTVALKVMLQGENASPDDLARFLREARASAKVSHPNVVPVYEIGEVGPVAYLTMELVDGPSLRQLIRAEGALPPRRAMVLVEQVARGVAEAHARQLIHRDLKPHNVLVAKGDVAKVMDFGLAKETGAEAQQGLTVSGAILGTPSYMAPEQAAGEAVGPSADIYGVGAILYEALTGRAPFEGPTLANIITQVLSKDVVPPRALQPRIHRDVETICVKALEKSPAARYPTAEALADDIARWLAGEAISARPIGLGERLVRRARRVGPVGAAAAALSVLVMGGAGWWAYTAPARVEALRLADEEARAKERAAAEALAQAEREREARAFEGRIAGARAELEAQAAAARTDHDVEAVAELAAERARAQAAEPPPADVAALVSGPHAVDPARVEAAAWLAVASASRAGAPPGVPCRPASRAAAMAYAAAPTDPEGIEGLVQVLEGRVDEAGEDVLADLFRGDAPDVPEAVASRVWSLRVDHHARSGRLAAAAATSQEAVERLPAHLVGPRLRRLASALGPYRRFLDVPGLPMSGAVPVPAQAGKPARVLVACPDGSVHLVNLPPAGRPVTASAVSVERRAPPLPGKPALSAVALTLVEGDRVLSAWFLRDTLEVVVRLDGEVVGTEDPRALRRQDDVRPEAFEWVELDGDPRTRELVVGIMPNSGDSVLVVVDLATARLRVVPLDPEGLHRGAGSTYLSASCASPAGDRAPWLALAYAAWGGHDVRLLGPDGGVVGTSGRLGTLQTLEACDLDGDGRAELIGGHVAGEEPSPRHAPPGLAAYAMGRGADAARRLWSLAGPTPQGGGWQGITRLLCFRNRAGRFAVAEWAQAGRKAGYWLVELGPTGAAHLINGEVPSGQGWSLGGAGDLDGDGDDELLQAAGTLRILGLVGAPCSSAPPSTALSVKGASPARQAVERLKDLGEPEALLRAARTAERLEGRTTAELDEKQLDALRTLTDDEVHDREVERFARDERRALGTRYEAIARRALRRLDSSDPAIQEKGAQDLRLDGLLDAQIPARAELARAARMQALRGATTGTTLTLDFGKEVETETEPLACLLVTNPHRLRVERGRGLVATVSRRARFHGGVPVRLPEGAIRVVLRLSTEGECWRGHAQVGLFRERDTAGGAPHAEGLFVDAYVFQTGASRRDIRHELTPRLLGSGLRDEAQRELQCEVAWPLLARRRLEVTIEHDPETGRGRLDVVDRDRDRVLVSRAGSWPRDAFSGDCLLGIYAPGDYAHDVAGVNTAPDAEVVLESASVTVLPAVPAEGGASTLPRLGRAALEDVYGDVALRAAAASSAKELRGRLLRGARDRPRSAARAALVLAAVAPRAEGAQAIRAALREDPMAALLAAEDDARLLGPAATAALRDALQATVADAGAPPVARVVAWILRDERDEAHAALAGLEAPDLSQADVLYLRLAARLDTELLAQLERLLPEHLPFPEHAHHLPALWRPTEDMAPAALDALLRERLEGTRDPREQLRWLDRWIALRPERADLRRSRVGFFSQLKDPTFYYSHWTADLRWLAARDPRDRMSRLQLAWLLCANLDYEAAGRVLREPPAFTREELTKALAGPLGDPDKDRDLAPFVEVVTGHDAAWKAFVLGLGQPR